LRETVPFKFPLLDHSAVRKKNRGVTMAQSKRATIAGVLIGIGMGGFVDGILLHQILQWHNMVSNWVPPNDMEAMKTNMLWDGIFHAFVWLVTLAGILLFWRAAYEREEIPGPRNFIGLFMLGWGSFNFVEGIIDHQILGIHYVRQVPGYAVYNLTFLAIGGILFILMGWLLMRQVNFRTTGS
jgi:uncharacterized membrane protein